MLRGVNTIFLSVRVLHILLGATWMGMAFFVVVFLMPAVRDAGPAGGQVMMGIGKRRLPAFIASISGLTVLTGLWLYWRYTDGFSPAGSATMGARIFGAGGVLGIIATALAGAVVGKNMKRAIALGTELQTAEPSRHAGLVTQIATHRDKAAGGARIVLALLIATFILMAMGHYV
jgi:uncharacterized membrane protein